MTKELKRAHEALNMTIASLASYNANIPIKDRVSDLSHAMVTYIVDAAEAERTARQEREREQWKRTEEALQLRAAATAYFDESILGLIGNRADIHTERERFIDWYVKPENVKTRQYRGIESMGRPDLRVAE